MLTLIECFFVNLATGIAEEVARYNVVAKQIIDLALFGAAQNRSYERLADFTDTIGNRVSGSHNLELAVQYMEKAFRQDGLVVKLGESALLSVSGDAGCEGINYRKRKICTNVFLNTTFV